VQFFIEPLISKDGIARERQAVDSEHSKNLQSDAWRQQQLWHTVAAPGHPYARFFTGNLATLATVPEGKGIDVHSRLWDFYNEQYSANRMKLCVLGRESLDELQDMVEAMFAAVQDKSALFLLFFPVESLFRMRSC
jgi:insulysin